MKIKQMPPFQRPREKLAEKGVDALTNEELIALIIRKGYAKKNAVEIGKTIEDKNILHDKPNSIYSSLQSLSGIGPTGAASLAAALELGRRHLETSTAPIISSVDDVLHTAGFIRDKKREYFVGLFLNARKQLITMKTISIGTLDSSLVHPREVFAPAMKLRAAHVIVVHNHPSGDPDPSRADLLVTKRLVNAGKVLGVAVLDHVIMSHSSHTSLKTLGLM